MPHLLLPHWTPTYNLTRSTMTQTCWATYGPETYRIKDSDAAWMRQWGLLSLDFESNEKIWHTMHPEDINAVQVDMAAQMKRLAPDTRVFTCACHHAAAALCQASSAVWAASVASPMLTASLCCRQTATSSSPTRRSRSSARR